MAISLILSTGTGELMLSTDKKLFAGMSPRGTVLLRISWARPRDI